MGEEEEEKGEEGEEEGKCWSKHLSQACRNSHSDPSVPILLAPRA